MGASSEADELEARQLALEAKISTLIGSTDAQAQRDLAEAQSRSASMLIKLRRFDDALTRSRQAEVSAVTAGESTWVASARILELTALIGLERYEEANDRAEGFAELITGLSNPLRLIRTFFTLSIGLFVRLGHEDEASSTADKLLALPSSGSDRERRWDAAALVQRAQVRVVLGDYQGALANVGDAIALRSLVVVDSEKDQTEVGHLMVLRAWVLEELGRGNDASVVYSEIRSRFGELIDIEGRGRLQRARLWHRRVHWLIRTNEIDELATLSRLLGELGATGDREAFTEVRDSLHDICGALGRAERYDDLLDATDGLIALLDRTSEPLDRGRATTLLASKAMLLEGLERNDEAASVEAMWKGRISSDTWAAMDEMAAQATDKHSPIRAQQRAALLLQRAAMLAKLEQRADAIALLEGFEAHFDAKELQDVAALSPLAEQALEELRHED